MFQRYRALLLGLLLPSIASAAPSQTHTPPAGQRTATGLIKLTGTEARRAAEGAPGNLVVVTSHPVPEGALPCRCVFSPGRCGGVGGPAHPAGQSTRETGA
jgi:hypothetical protein